VAAILAAVSGAMIFAGPDIGRRILAGAGCVGSVVLVALSESRAALLALAVGGAVTLILLALRKDTPWRKYVAAGLLLIAVPVAVNAGRIATIFSTTYETNRVRLAIWPGAAAVGLEHPVLGCGAGNFRFVYPPHRRAEEFDVHFTDPAVFREVEDAHSTYLQIWSEGGALSVLAFLLLLYIAFRLWRYHWRHAEDYRYASAYAGLAGGAAAFLVAGLAASLDGYAATWILFWLILGCVEGLGIDRSRRRLIHAGEVSLALALVGGVLSAFAIYFTGALAVADRHFQAAMTGTDQPAVRIARLQSSLSAFPPQWRANSELGTAFLRADQFSEAQVHLQRALDLHPDHVLTIVLLAELHYRCRRFDKAMKLLDRAVELAPFYYSTFLSRAMVRYDLGDRAGAREDCVRAKELRPELEGHPAVRKILGTP
jgi:tetratricopeptide (TPR) repeat protein